MNNALILTYQCQLLGAEIEEFLDKIQDPPQDPMLQEEMEKLAQLMRKTADTLSFGFKCP